MNIIRRTLSFAWGGGYIERESLERPLLLGWLLSLPFAWFAAGYLSHLYPAWIMPIVILGLLTVVGIWGLWAVRRAPKSATQILGWFALVLVADFGAAIIGLCLSYPQLFDRSLFQPTDGAAAWFIALAVLAPSTTSWFLRTLHERGVLQRMIDWPAIRFAHEHLPGLILCLLFAALYLGLSHVFNRPGIDTTENFFAADNFSWLNRLAAAEGTQIEMRAVHPFAYFIFRPSVWLFALLFNGDRVAATLWLVPIVGGLCVLLAWLFVYKWSGSSTYAMLWASILGISTTHLLFASFIETYIFSAALLLLFYLLLLDEATSVRSLLLVGVATFGVTITNFIQTFIGFVIGRPKFKAVLRYGLIASALAIALTVLHAAVYPSALVFFLPQDAAVESEYSIDIFDQPAWRLTGRAALLARNIFLYSVVAPTPVIQTEEVGGVFPRFNFFKISPGAYRYSAYDGLGQVLILAWIAILAAAAAMFSWNLIRRKRADLSLAFALCLLFNFVLHMGYGFEPFLYAADWTYALILLVAISLARFAEDRRLQAGLLVFLGLLMINQWGFMRLILDSIAPFFG